MMTRLIIILFILSTTAQNSISQNVNRNEIISLLSTEQKMVRSAIDSSVCIIMQEYVLSDSAGNEYGRNDNRYFGRTFSLGIISDSGILTSSEILFPWKEDKAFDKFKNKANLLPKLSKTSFRRSYEPAFRELSNTKPIMQNDSAVTRFSLPDSAGYIGTIQDTKDTTGWIVLISNKENINTENSAYPILVLRPKVTARDSSTNLFIVNNPIPEKDNIIGGAYFTYRVSLGRIVFMVAGILKKEGPGWVVKTFSKTTHGTGNNETLNQLNKTNTTKPIESLKEK